MTGVQTCALPIWLTAGDWPMDEARQAEVLYRWMMSSVKDAEGILARKFGNLP